MRRGRLPRERQVHALPRARPAGDRIPDSLKAGTGARRTAPNTTGMNRSPPDGSTANGVPMFDPYILGRRPIGRALPRERPMIRREWR